MRSFSGSGKGKAKRSQPSPAATSSGPAQPQPVEGGMRSLGVHGSSHGDTKPYESWSLLTLTKTQYYPPRELWHYRVHSITIWADHRWVWSLEWQYQSLNDGSLLTGGRYGASERHTRGDNGRLLQNATSFRIEPVTLTGL
jgi:hypothetical protein